MLKQKGLFTTEMSAPNIPGLAYTPGFISAEEEQELISNFPGKEEFP